MLLSEQLFVMGDLSTGCEKYVGMSVIQGSLMPFSMRSGQDHIGRLQPDTGYGAEMAVDLVEKYRVLA